MTIAVLADRPTALYRLFCGEQLLYVGISCDPDGRLLDHKAQKPWWPDVDRVKVTWCRDRMSALRDEAWAIALEVPLYNDHRPDPLRFGTRNAGMGTSISFRGLSIGEAAKYLRVAPVELFDLISTGVLPHNRAGSTVWFSKSHIRFIQHRMARNALAVAGDFMGEIYRLPKPPQNVATA